MRVLVADGSRDFNAILAVLAGESGHDVVVASTGLAAIEAAAARRPDVAFIGLVLPDQPGWEVARAIRRSYEGREPVLVACSGLDPSDPSLRGHLSCFSNFLVKSHLSLEDLKRAVADAIKQAASLLPS